jgi:hypothetical protein
MATTTNYGWTTPDDTDLVKDGASAIRTLGSSVDTTTKNLNPETTLGDLSFRSSTSNVNTRIPIGSSGQHLTVVAGVPAWSTASDQTPLTTKGDIFTFSTLDARLGVGANGTVLQADSAEATGLKWATPSDQTPLTTKGDLFTFSTLDARLPVGTNTHVLTADSAEATGLKWAAPASGGGMTLISETVASASTGISFTSIPGTYKQLLLVFNGLYHSGVGSQFNPRFNASAVSEYVNQGMKNGGTTNANDTTAIRPPEPVFGEDATSSTNYNTINGYLLVDNYASTTKFKYFQCGSAYLGTSFFFIQGFGFWENTSAITSIDITRVSGSATISNITNTTLRLYGIS